MKTNLQKEGTDELLIVKTGATEYLIWLIELQASSWNQCLEIIFKLGSFSRCKDKFLHKMAKSVNLFGFLVSKLENYVSAFLSEHIPIPDHEVGLIIDTITYIILGCKFVLFSLFVS